MNIPNKREVLLVVLGLLSAFAFGRYSVSGGGDTRTTQVESQHHEVERNRDTHSVTHTVTQRQPDGTTSTDTVVTTDSRSSTSSDTQTSVQQSTETKKAGRSKINVSALIAEDIHQVGQPTYGISFQKEFIGPVTIGAFGLTNGVVGVSIGLNF